MSALQCQILDCEDLPAIGEHLAVAHAANASQEPLAVYAAKRLHHSRRRTGQWWLGTFEGRAVCSLMCYPLALSDAAGSPVQGYGLGAVATRPEARKQGYASQLCRAAVAAAEAGGRTVGLLYSAIPSAFYERMGFRVCPSFRFASDDPLEVASSGAQAQLTACDPLPRAEELSAVYRRCLAGRLQVLRDPGSWRTSWTNYSDEWCFLIDGGGGYIRAYEEGDALEIVELCPPAGQAPQPALRALAALAVALGRKRLVGWLEPSELAGSSFHDLGRARTLPMLRGVSEADASAARFFGSDYF